jgi:hypothetical protein
MSDARNQIRELSKRLEALAPLPQCQCDGGAEEVTITGTSRNDWQYICNRCRGAIPSGTKIFWLIGAFPSHPDHPEEQKLMDVVP